MRLRFKPAASAVASAIVMIFAATVTSLALSSAPRTPEVIAAQAAPGISYEDAGYRETRMHQAQSWSPRIYTVRRGDTLSAIAARFSLSWEGLYWANRHTIGGSPDSIYPGEVLILRTEAGYKPPVWRKAARAVRTTATATYYGVYSFSGLEALWVSAGGPRWAEWAAATIAMCESGGRPWAKNPTSPASGLWQIDGLPFPGNPFNPWTNALMAVWKFKHAGYNFSPWVCRA